MKIAQARPLTAALFSGFGEVLEPGAAQARPVNQGRGHRFDVAPGLVHDPAAARPASAIYRLSGTKLPFAIEVLERHPLSSQVFWPLQEARALVAVAPALPGGSPDLARFTAFTTGSGQGFHYLPGIWHAPLFALDRDASFAMLMWETGDARDCEEFWLDEPVTVEA